MVTWEETQLKGALCGRNEHCNCSVQRTNERHLQPRDAQNSNASKEQILAAPAGMLLLLELIEYLRRTSWDCLLRFYNDCLLGFVGLNIPSTPKQIV